MSQPTTGSRLPANPVAAFAAVLGPRPSGQPARSFMLDDEQVTGFVEACRTAIRAAFEDPAGCELTPGVEVEQPEAMLLAYLLCLASTGGAELAADDVRDWSEAVTPAVWRLLGFESRPNPLTVSLAFSLLGQVAHVAPELRALVWVIGDLAHAGLLVRVGRR